MGWWKAVHVIGRAVVVASALVASVVRAETPSPATPTPSSDPTPPAALPSAAPTSSPGSASSPAPASSPGSVSSPAPASSLDPALSPDPASSLAPALAPTATVSPAPALQNERSPALAFVLSGPPTMVGAGLAIAGLVIANRDQECTGDPSVPPGVTCIDHFPTGLRLTVIGGALLAIGPSLGHIYNRRVWTTGLKIRLIGVGVSVLGIGLVAAPSSCGKTFCGPQAIGLLAVIGGAATFGVGAVHDVATAYSATRDRNMQLTIAPLRTPSGTTPGLVLQTSF